MRNYVKNRIKDRLMYCKDWRNSVEIYLEGKKIYNKTNKEFYKSKPFLKIILDLYYLPYNMCKLVEYLKMIYQYKKNETEIKVLSRELNEGEN
ncbi:hypothetical protein OAQ73_00535 [Candidatus Pelagibacter sp.]|jgi:hypothetical protein|nr:hypothetical protein [Candidatus Pelagibacter sp.]|tara:strand:+ start:27 stop:305 length:279 start_codon:yes stop_codon:yes gene_type:complete